MMNDILGMTIDFHDQNLDQEELENFTVLIYKQIDQFEVFDQVTRVRENPPENTRSGDESLGKLILGQIKARIGISNISSAIRYIYNLMSGKRFKLIVEANGRTLVIESSGSSKEEVVDLIKAAQDFVS